MRISLQFGSAATAPRSPDPDPLLTACPGVTALGPGKDPSAGANDDLGFADWTWSVLSRPLSGRGGT